MNLLDPSEFRKLNEAKFDKIFGLDIGIGSNVTVNSKLDKDVPVYTGVVKRIQQNGDYVIGDLTAIDGDLPQDEIVVQKDRLKINEAKFDKLFDILDTDKLYAEIKKVHPRSMYLDIFMTNLKRVLDGEEVPRAEFRVKTGEQWVFEELDKLIAAGHFEIIKRGNKQIVKLKD